MSKLLWVGLGGVTGYAVARYMQTQSGQGNSSLAGVASGAKDTATDAIASVRGSASDAIDAVQDATSGDTGTKDSAWRERASEDLGSVELAPSDVARAQHDEPAHDSDGVVDLATTAHSQDHGE